jgi:3-methyladenine DNA glycosylase AlkD
MEQPVKPNSVIEIASQIDAEIQTVPVRNTPKMRTVRRKYSRELKEADAEFILDLARELLRNHDYRWLAYELIQGHEGAFESLGKAELEELGQGINSWWTVDSFARILSGPTWLSGQIPDAVIHKWARSENRWWRRAALVSTVALNVRSHGGMGDIPRTLAVCQMLLTDHDDMVVKAMSWALRELVPHDPDALGEFLSEHEGALAARVKREVMNKITTGLKNPKMKKDA